MSSHDDSIPKITISFSLLIRVNKKPATSLKYCAGWLLFLVFVLICISNRSRKIIKKTLKIGSLVLGIAIALVVAAWLTIQSPAVQTWLTQKFAGILSEKYHTTISVQGVSVRFFNKVVLEEVLIEDQKKDSLVYVKELVADIDSFSLKRKFVAVGKLKLDQTRMFIEVDSAGRGNYEFLTDAFKSNARDTSGRSLDVWLTLDSFEFSNARVRYAFADSTGRREINLDHISLGISGFKIQEQKTLFSVDNFQFTDRGEFELQEFKGKVEISPDSLNVRSLRVKTLNSEITEATLLIDKSQIGREMNLRKLRAAIDLKQSFISLKDIGIAIPELRGMDDKIEVMGQISGTLADLKGKNIELSLGGATRLNFDAYLNGLPDFANTYLHVDLKQSFADFRELAQVKLPDRFPLKQIDMPKQLLQAGIIEYQGNFTGFLSDFVAYGTLRSKWGVLNTDLSFVPTKGDELKINGRLKTVNFQLGELVQTNLLDHVTFDGNISGLLNQVTSDFSASVSGKIDSIDINQYHYRNIQMNGDIENKKFDGNLLADDPNLKMSFEGEFNLNKPEPDFNFKMNVERANLIAMNLVDRFKRSDIAFDLDANFTGNNIDNIVGKIHFKNGSYQNENGLLDFSNIDLKTFSENVPVLQLRSDFLDADIRGHYQLHNLYSSVRQIISRYLPSSGVTAPVQKLENTFDFKLNLKDLNRFTQVLIPELRMMPAEIDGRINSENNTLVLNGTFPEIQYRTSVLKNYTLNVDGDSKMNIRNKVEEIALGDQFKVYNFLVISEAESDVLDSKISWNNNGAVSYAGSLDASARFFPQKGSPHIELSVKPTRISVADSVWQINSSLITIDSTMVKVDKLKFSSRGQSVTIDGTIDRTSDHRLNFNFGQVDLSLLDRFTAQNLKLKGEINGTMSLIDIYRKPLFLANLGISDLGLLGETFGDATTQSRWDPDLQEMNAELVIKSGDKETLQAFGTYSPGLDSLSVYTNFDHFSILILQPLMGSSFANFHGDATGKVWIHGNPNHFMHDGALYASNAGLMLSDMKVNYTLNDSVKFIGDKIVFPDIPVFDDFGNRGVFSGSIQHRTFSKMVYNLALKSDRIMVFNTTVADNEQFYGKLFGSGDVSITGRGATVLIDGSARTERGTEMNISLEYQGDAQEYDFLTFISHSDQSDKPVVKPPYSNSDLQMRFDVDVTPEAKAQLIYNSKIGDMIKAQGSGNMQINIDNDYNIKLYGEYTVEQGDYLFTLQNVINKRFEIQQGGTIEWNGDPYDATLDINAIYHLKAALNELYAGAADDNDYNQRIPVECKITLTKSVSNPEIKLDINFPTAEASVRDEVGQYISTDEDMNKQILSLLVLGKFYTPEHLRGGYSGGNSNLVGSTASELFSNQLSNWLSEIVRDFDVGFKYRPGNQITNDEVELALSTQLFNDRVSINGNIGNNASQRISANSNSFVGDADVNVKLTRNGKLRLKAYNHANNNLIYETSPYTQGVGFTYREDFDNFNELWKKVKSLFPFKSSAGKKRSGKR